jgi:benzoate/toluate 1,2-dioxygenase alpha subunit
MTENLARVREVLADAVIDDRENGIIRAKREIFTDQDIFEMEMKHIFEGNWVYLAHESQIPNVGDYFTTYIGRTPVVITRDKEGKLNCIVNACSHRGAMLCRRKTDNRTTFTCPFHGWTFKNSGRTAQRSRTAAVPATPSPSTRKAPTTSPRLPASSHTAASLFGSLNADVLPLEDHLGDATKVIDSIVDQSPTAWRSCAVLQPTPTTATGRYRQRTAPTATT